MIIVLIVVACVLALVSSISGGVVAWYYNPSEEEPSSSPSSSTPSPQNCEVDWNSAEWQDCDADTCGSTKSMYQYRTGIVKKQSKHGGRECPDLTEFRLIQADSNPSSVTTTPSDPSDNDSSPPSTTVSDDTSSPATVSDYTSSPPPPPPPPATMTPSPPAYTIIDRTAVTGQGLDRNGDPVSTGGGYKYFESVDFVKAKCNSFPNCVGFHYNNNPSGNGVYGQLKQNVLTNRRVDNTYQLYVKNST